MSGREAEGATLASPGYPAAENEGFSEEFDPTLPNTEWPDLVPPRAGGHEHPEILLSLPKARDTFPRTMPNSTVLGDYRPRSRATPPKSASNPFPKMPQPVDLFLPNAELARRLEGLSNATTTLMSVGSPAESDIGLEPGCSTRLLNDEKSGVRSVAQMCNFHTTPASHMNHHHHHHHPLCHQEVAVKNCPSEIFFLHWNWPAIRMGCLVTMLSSLVASICVVVAVLIIGPFHCNPSRQWWQGTVMYEIFPASFQDTDSDGYGDLQGIINHLDYIQSLNVQTIRLNSIFSALDYPLEYEHIIDFSNVDPHLGRMDDFRALVDAVHARNMYIVVDLNPAVSSDQHSWALHWQLGRSGYEDFYVHSNNSLNQPEMESTEGPPRSEWRLPHRTFGNQLYLNWSSSGVRREMSSVVNWWLDSGVDGFYMKHLDHLHVADEEERYLVLRQWRDLLDRRRDSQKVLMTSVDFVEYLRSVDSPVLRPILSLLDLLDVPLHVAVNRTETLAEQLTDAVYWTSLSPLPWLTWHLGSADSFRLASRLESDHTLGAFFLLLMLPGSTSIFYGDEIGLRNAYDVYSNKVFRGGQFAPMQWTLSPHANFTDNETSPWLPVHPEYLLLNVQNQSERISVIRKLVSLRNTSMAVAMQGVFDDNARQRKPTYKIHHIDPGVLVMERYYPRRPRLLLCANFGSTPQVKDFSRTFYEVRVLTSTGRKTGYLTFHRLVLDPGEVFVGELTT